LFQRDENGEARTIRGFTWVELLLSEDYADELRDR